MTSSICLEPRVPTRPRSPTRLQVSLARRQANNNCFTEIEGIRPELWVNGYLKGLPLVYGSPIHLQFLPSLTVHRGRLILGAASHGKAVYAASFLPERRMVLEEALAANPTDLRLILTHEIFHFVWWKLGNRRRAEFDALLRTERSGAAWGELGESSLVAKQTFVGGSVLDTEKRWKNYVCESFCDTGAWLYAGVTDHGCFQLAAKWRRRRAQWLQSLPSLKA